MTVARSVEFLKHLIEDCPFKITKILTDNGSQFTYELLSEHLKPKDKIHPFDNLCKAHNIEHRLTKFKHPWTNGQVEIFNKTIKNNTTKTYHYETIDELKRHLMSYLLYYNHQKKLKALKFKSPYAILLEKFDLNPELFKENPYLKLRGLNR
jgi:transposase InsO family protein